MTGGCSIVHSLDGLVQKIRVIATHMKPVKFSHVFREANQFIDALAKIDLFQPTLLADRASTLFSRGF